MKPRPIVLIIVGLVVCSLAGLAQTNPPAGAVPATGAGATTTTNAEPPAAVVPAAEAAPAAAGLATTNVAAQPGAVIPIIIMDDVKLTDAVRNLARMAGVNYMLDPKIGFGQIGPDGRPVAEPSVSIRWENVTAEQALNALLSNYDLQIVEDPKSKIARVTKKDPSAPEPLVSQIIQLKYASPTNIINAVTNTFTDRRSKAVADVRTSQLVVLATEKEMAGVDQLVERLDKQTRQVLIEARLFETSMNPQTSKGIDWRNTLEAQHLSYGNGVMSGQSTTTIPGAPTTTTLPGGRTVTSRPSSSTSTILDSVLGNGGFSLNTASGLTPNVGFLNADGLKAVLSFINEDVQAKVISAPRTVTLDNESAHIQVTRATPIINVTAGTANTTGGSQINYTNLGVILDVTPRISANNFVNLKVVPEVSRFVDTKSKVVNGATFEADEYDIRKVETRVLIPSGNTLVMGGLMQDNVNNQITKVPVLGDIPILGWAFKSDARQRQKSNLLIFLTPTIVEDEDYQPTQSDFLKTPMVDSVQEPEWSAWDSAKPLDWSKPLVK